MNLCLINPPSETPKRFGVVNIFQPLGLAYIAAALERDGHQVSIVDALAEGWINIREVGEKIYVGLEYEKLAERVARLSPDIVGVTVPFSRTSACGFEVARAVKEIDRDMPVVIGGHHPSVRPIDCVSDPNIDFVVVGEGEATIVELVNVLAQGRCEQLQGVKGIAYKKNGKSVLTLPRPLIENLDTLPFPARHLLPMNIYFEAAKKGRGPRPELYKPWATMITSRGCPYNCVFCAIHNTMGRKWRPRSPELVVEEIEQLVYTYGTRQIDFEDDNLTLRRKSTERICDLIIERGLDIDWYTPNGVRADTLDEALLMKMKKSGLKMLWISPESGVQRVVDEVIGKHLDLKKVELVVRLCKKLGINVGCFFVVGLIGETKEDIRATIDYAKNLKKLGATDLQFSIATPHYGTRLYDQARALGYLRGKFGDESVSTWEALIETTEFRADEVHELWEEGRAIGPALTKANIKWAMRDPRRALSFLLRKMRQRVRQANLLVDIRPNL